MKKPDTPKKPSAATKKNGEQMTRQERAAQSLRENLKRRKQQTKARMVSEKTKP